MKGVIAAAALAALTGTVNAHHLRRGHHEVVAKRNTATTDCPPGQTTLLTSTVGGATRPPYVDQTTGVVAAPTPIAYTFPAPGTYTLPSSVVTVTEPTTVCGPASTQLPSGTHTIGGVTTVVDKATTVVLPVATVTTIDNVPTSTIVQATFTCPSAGTYTLNPITTTVTKPTVVYYPTKTTFPPGTYAAPSQVVTVTKADHVTYCPFTSVGLPAAKPTAPALGDDAVSPKPTEDAPKYSDDHETTYKPAVIESRSAAISSNNDHLGITYTPYDSNSGACKSAAQVDQDIAKFHGAGFNVVRVYSTDCNTLDSVGNACAKYGMKMIIGVFIGGPGCSYNTPNIKTQVDAISAWGRWNLVQLLVVGNEAIVNGFCSGAQLRDLIQSVKSKCPAYRGPYTVSETLDVWQRGDFSRAICPVVDMAGANIHAYFTPSVRPESAGSFVGNQLGLLERICPGKPGMILESGWPTKGRCNGVACPGQDQQTKAIQSIRQAVGGRTIFFSPENDQWKTEGSCGCEKSWGSMHLFGL